MAKKIIPLSKLKEENIDTIKLREDKFGTKNNNTLLIKLASEWENWHQFRKERDRAKRYCYGDQWSDLISNGKGKVVTERELIKSQGNIPLVNNLIRRLVNSVIGMYVKAQTEPVCSARDRDEQKDGEMMTVTLQSNWQRNKMDILLPVLLEDFLIGSAVFTRETFEYRDEQKDSYTDICNPNYMIVNSEMKDPRHWDVNLIGEIHDIPFNELCSKFAKSNEEYLILKDIYSNQELARVYSSIIEDVTKKHDLRKINFYSPQDPSMCRVYEVWTKELKPRYRCIDMLAEFGEDAWYKIEAKDLPKIQEKNQQRIKDGIEQGIPENEIPLIQTTYFIDSYWYYQFLAPNGTILKEGETPYLHKSHPYTCVMYPFVNGEIHSFVNDIIDQQRYINRMIILNDFVIRTGAKGVTIVPENCIPDSMTPEEFAEEYTSVDGLLIYKPIPGGQAPQQIYSNSQNIGATEMIQLQLQMMEDIAGVHGAVQGKSAYSGTSASLYAQQSANSSAMLANILQRFSSFTEDIAVKKVKTIQQFYNERRIINIAGKNYQGSKIYEPDKIRNVQFDLSIKESAATPVHRMIANDMLMDFWKNGAISIEMLLENGDFPFADQLLQSIGVAKENAANQQPPQGIDPNVMKQVQVAANQQQVQNATKILQQ